MIPTNFLSLFDPTRKLYIKQDIHISGRLRKRGEYYDWRGAGEPYQTILTMFNQDFFYHKEDEEEDKEVFADVLNKNLDGMSLPELHAYIDKLNEKFQTVATTTKEFKEKKCPKVPKDVEAQVRRIKLWRNTYGHKFE